MSCSVFMCCFPCPFFFGGRGGRTFSSYCCSYFFWRGVFIRAPQVLFFFWAGVWFFFFLPAKPASFSPWTSEVYATCCSIFLAVAPPCVHADTQRELNLESYLARAWCRLEKLSYAARQAISGSDPTVHRKRWNIR